MVELLLAFAIGSAVLVVSAGALFSSSSVNLRSYQNQRAELYLQEAVEVVKTLVVSDWNNISINGIFHPEVTGDSWTLIDNEETIDIYERKVEIGDLFRDENGNVATTGGMIDPSTKKITTMVSWQMPRPGSVSQIFLPTRWQGNTTWTEDSLNDFSDGVEDATDVTTNPGFIQLAQTGGSGDWTEPGIIQDMDALAKLNGIFCDNGYLFAALGSTKKQIQVFDISTDPQNPSSLGAFNTTDEVNNIAVENGYLYAALNNESHGIEIFDISANPANPSQVGTAATGSVPSGLWVQNNYLFVSLLDNNKVEVYSLSNPASPSLEGFFNTSERAVDVSGSGNYLYVAQETTREGIEIFDISTSVVNPTSLAIIATFYPPTGIWIEGNTLYLSLKEKRTAMYNLLYRGPTNPTLLGIFQTNQNTADITALGDYGYVAGMDSWSRAIAVIYVAESKGLSGIYFVYGEYISSALDVGNSAAFNRISWEGNEPANTNILFQISLNDDNLTWNFVGPDGTAASYFESPAAFPLNNILGRYFKYKAILVGDSLVTPIVDRVVVNYSP